VAIDRATRWVYIAIHPNKSAASARAFLKALAKACPIKITKLLTENEPQAKFQRSYSGSEFKAGFAQTLEEYGIARWYTYPQSPTR